MSSDHVCNNILSHILRSCYQILSANHVIRSCHRIMSADLVFRQIMWSEHVSRSCHQIMSTYLVIRSCQLVGIKKNLLTVELIVFIILILILISITMISIITVEWLVSFECDLARSTHWTAIPGQSLAVHWTATKLNLQQEVEIWWKLYILFRSLKYRYLKYWIEDWLSKSKSEVIL